MWCDCYVNMIWIKMSCIRWHLYFFIILLSSDHISYHYYAITVTWVICCSRHMDTTYVISHDFNKNVDQHLISLFQHIFSLKWSSILIITIKSHWLHFSYLYLWHKWILSMTFYMILIKMLTNKGHLIFVRLFYSSDDLFVTLLWYAVT